MADRYKFQKPELYAPYFSAFEIEANSAVIFDAPTRGIYVGAGGDLTVEMLGFFNVTANTVVGNNIVTFSNIANSSLLEIRISRVLDGTSAGDLLGLL